MITRWVPSRKAALLADIERGALSLEEAERHYDLSPEELTEWRRALAAHGVPGLRTTRLQIYKHTTVKLSNTRGRYWNSASIEAK